MTQIFKEIGVGVVHHFAGGLYCKETHIPAGVKLMQHKHSFDHLSVLAKGRALVTVDGMSTEYAEGSFLTIVAGKVHEVTALTDVVWGCLHASSCTDPEEIDHELIAK
jgi:mannose-6-phosphate isomerase-like protein (cupin superfamily)